MITKKRALEILREFGRTHIAWAGFLRAHPKFDDSHVGTVGHHEKCLKKYDEVIEYIERNEQ